MTDQEIRDQNLALMQQYQTLLFGQRFDAWIELWAEDAICEFPFAGPGRPRALRGKKEIFAYMTAFPSRFSVDGVDELRVHQGLDPNLVVVEMTIRARTVPTDRPYPQQYVIVAEARDGKLAHYREYWNPLVSAEAFA